MKIPNMEIQISLNALFIDYLTDQRTEQFEFRSQMYDALHAGDLESFMKTMKRLFPSISHHNYSQKKIQKYEGYYASVVYAYLASLGLQLIAEDSSSKGRVDMTIILPDKVFVIVFKVDQPGKALEQIKSRGYHKKYIGGKREVYIVGINFDSSEKNITECVYHIYEK